MTTMSRRILRSLASMLVALVIGVVAIRLADTGGVVSAASEPATPEIGYSGDHGPGFWGETPGWETCGGTATTARQSPIDIDHVVADPRLRPLRLELHETPLDLTNNGHTIEQEYEPGSSIALNGLVYGLSQFHFHTLSEHTIAGQHAGMELHAVFADPASSNKAVVGMLFRIGKPNHFIAALLANGLPQKSGDVVEEPSHLINLADGLTNTFRYYTYAGSLTTPPCSETVTWFVLRQQAELSLAQFEKFRIILGNDFRPLQKRNGRVIRSTAGGEDGQDSQH